MLQGMLVLCKFILCDIFMQVLGATCDGASVNRRLIKIHDLKAKLTFKVPNPYANDRDIVFFSDPPHLIKTTRNCWSSKARSLWVCHNNYLLCQS